MADGFRKPVRSKQMRVQDMRRRGRGNGIEGIERLRSLAKGQIPHGDGPAEVRERDHPQDLGVDLLLVQVREQEHGPAQTPGGAQGDVALPQARREHGVALNHAPPRQSPVMRARNAPAPRQQVEVVVLDGMGHLVRECGAFVFAQRVGIDRVPCRSTTQSVLSLNE